MTVLADDHPVGMSQEEGMGMVGPPIRELGKNRNGRWLVETVSGSRHLFDLDSMSYARRGTRIKGLKPRFSYGVKSVDQWPKVNSTFRVALDRPAQEEFRLASSYVTRIVPLAQNEHLEADLPRQSLLQQASGAPPSNAWLLIGDEASFPTTAELKAQRRLRNPEINSWTSPRQIQRGDLVFVYYMNPRKAVHFVARALNPPVFESSIEVNSIKPVDPHQWWTDLTPFVEVPPIPFKLVRDLHGGHLILRGKPTHYLTPDIVSQLINHCGVLNDEQRLVMQRPVGDAALPDPANMSLATLRRISAGALRLEAQVEQYVAEPVLAKAFPASRGFRIEKQYRIEGAGIADYGIFERDQLIGVVEVKLGITRLLGSVLGGSPDLEQLGRYCSKAKVPGLLIDANEIVLVDLDSLRPVRLYERQRLTRKHLGAISSHLQPPFQN